jgi:uncharacterized protein
MFQMNVAQLLKESIGATRNVLIDDTLEVEGYGRTRVEGEAVLTRTNRSILVRANLHSCLQTSCARCLEPCACPIDFKFDEEYFPITDVSSGKPLTEPEEPEPLTIDAQLTLDLSEAVRQYIITSAPMKPLCRTDCQGIKYR